MTVSSSITTHSYIPAGAMLPESLAGLVFINASDLVVTDPAAAVQVLGTDYEITGNGRTGAASIRTLRVYGAGIVLTVTRVTESAQLANIQPNQPLPAEAIETELDRRALIEQEGRREIGVLNQRALKVPTGEVAPVMPTLALRIGKFFTWGAVGEIIPASGTGADAALRADLAQSTGSSLLGWLQAGVGAVLRSITDKLRTRIDVKDFGAVGNAVADDTAALQAAINHVQNGRFCKLYLPPCTPGGAYRISAPLVIAKTICIEGANTNDTVIGAYGFAAGQPVFNINEAAVGIGNVIYNLRLRDLYLFSNNGLADGIHLKNCAYTTLDDINIQTVRDGIKITGGNCYSNFFRNCSMWYQITRYGCWFNGFTGGGQYGFRDCTFAGDIGFFVDSGSAINALTLDNCNFEQCVTNSLRIQGTVLGLSIPGVRTEGVNGAQDFLIAPTAGAPLNFVSGVSIRGGFFKTDNSAAAIIQIGGGTGEVIGFDISGNYAQTGAHFVFFNGGGQTGAIENNFLFDATMLVVNAPRATINVRNNRNGAGPTPEYEGVLRGGVQAGTFVFTDASAAAPPLVLVADDATFRRQGSVVHWWAIVQYPVTADANVARLSGLPFTVDPGPSAEGRSGARVDMHNAGMGVGIRHGITGANRIDFGNPITLSDLTNANLSGKLLYMSGSYVAAA